MQKITLSLLIALIASFILHADIWDDIRTTALAPNNGPNGRALPLAGAWDTGWSKYQWGDNRYGTVLEPSHIVWLISNQNRHVVAHINHLAPGLGSPYTTWYNTYLSNNGALNYLKDKNQPITVGGIDNGCGGLVIWERRLYVCEPYKSLLPDFSPRFYGTNFLLLDKLTPFPPVVSKWYDVGTNWVDGSPGMDMLQSLYPNPSKIIFLSDNEANRANWFYEAETDQRYMDLYGAGHDDNFKRQKFAEGWTSCYTQMFTGMRSGFNADWRNNSIFIGWEAGGCWSFFGRQSNWQNYALFYDNKISWEQNAWDGDSMGYYRDDFKVQSAQVAAQNRVFMLADQLAEKPDFWFEMSVWNGGVSYINTLTGLGQTMTGARYKGFIQFGMWLLTPRLVRHYSEYVDRETEGFEYFDAVMDAVDRVHTDPVLKRFWQYGTLVENTSRTHPYQMGIPTEFAGRSRWFQLNTNLDPARPWSLTAEIPIFAIARLIGTSPNREWLVYAHSPVQDRTNVVITLPGYGTVTTDVLREGTFLYVQETLAPTIFGMPVDQTADPQIGTTPATTATFSVQANGTNLTYQWQKWNGSWQNVGTNCSAYVTPPVAAADDGTQYRVIVSNSYGSSTSVAATLHVNFGCVGYWKFDEASGTSAADSSGNANTGTLINQAQFVSSGGILNGTVSLDGTDDYVRVPCVPALKYQGGELTLSTWIYINSTESSGARVISKPWNGSGQYNYLLSLGSDCKVSFILQFGVPGCIGITSPAALSKSAWHHVAVTVVPTGSNNYGMVLYVDGVQAVSNIASYSGSWIPTGGDGNAQLCLGQVYAQNYGTPAYSLDGKLDSVRIYDHALYPEAIAEQARCPVGYWKFDEASGTNAADSSGNENTGTLINQAQLVSSGGKFNGAVSFDGTDDYVRVNDVLALKYQGGELTLSTWIYINSTESSGARVISKPWNGSGQYNYLLSLGSDCKVSFILQFGVPGCIGITSPATLSKSAWHHVAATVVPTGSNNYAMVLYVDGVQAVSNVASYSGSWIPSYGDGNKQLCLGHVFPMNYGTSAYSLDGKLDEVRIYNRVLSAAAIGKLAGK